MEMGDLNLIPERPPPSFRVERNASEFIYKNLDPSKGEAPNPITLLPSPPNFFFLKEVTTA
jgi:hypothetical protein